MRPKAARAIELALTGLVGKRDTAAYVLDDGRCCHCVEEHGSGASAGGAERY